MILPLLTLVAFGGIAAYELWPLWRARRWRALSAAGTVWLLALAYSMLQVLHVPFPDVNAPINSMFGSTAIR